MIAPRAITPNLFIKRPARKLPYAELAACLEPSGVAFRLRGYESMRSFLPIIW